MPTAVMSSISPMARPLFTDKDAMKLSELDIDLSHIWALEIAIDLPEDFAQAFAMLLQERHIEPQGQ